MTQKKLALAGGCPVRQKPWPRWPQANRDTESLLIEALNSGRWAISGPYTGKPCFERRFAEAFACYNNVQFCVPTTSGSSALTLALLALEIGFDDEVLVPGLTWVACASAVLAVGALPVLVDIDTANLAMSFEAAKLAITTRTKAILLVHPFCRLADIERFMELSKKTGIPIIEDCSQAHGATLRGKRVGTFGVVGCFSMQQSKVLTSGEGGAAITNSSHLCRRLEQLRCDGRVFTEQTRVGRLELVEVGEVQGRNHCLSEFQAAILLEQLKHLDEQNDIRRRCADFIYSSLQGLPGVYAPPCPIDVEPSYYNLALEFDPKHFSNCTIDLIGRALGEELAILVHPIYTPMNDHPLYRPALSALMKGRPDALARANPKNFELPNAKFARERFLTLPHRVLLDIDEGPGDIREAIQKVQQYSDELVDLCREPTLEAF